MVKKYRRGIEDAERLLAILESESHHEIKHERNESKFMEPKKPTTEEGENENYRRSEYK